MNLSKVLLFACVVALISLPVFAQQNINFINSDGMFDATGIGAGNTLSLGGSPSTDSTLIQVSGFTGSLSGYNGTGDLGSLYFTTGALMSTSGCASPPCTATMVPLTGEKSTFGPSGQTFNVVDTANGGFTFTGDFSKEHWFCVGTCTKINTNHWTGNWQFNGLITDAQLTIGGQVYPVSGAVTYQGTVEGGKFTRNATTGALSVTDTGGTTNFNIAPEPGTLTLFGSGLIAVGLLTKYRRSRKSTGSTSADW